MNLNGLQSTPPRRPGFFQRLLRRPVKENAVIEITNLFAEREIESVSLPEVADILKHYNVGFAESKPQFVEIYRKVLDHLTQDRALSAEDTQKLTHLQSVLDLSKQDTETVREDVLAAVYANALSEVLTDRHISTEERARLDAISSSFGLAEDRVRGVYKDQVIALIKVNFDRIIADRRITSDEEGALRSMAENLGVTLEHGAETRALIDRFKQLARIDEGDLPVLSPPLKLQRGEICHATYPCIHQEIRTRTTSYRHSGISTSVRIIGNVRWRVGQVNVQRVTRDEMVQLDSGTLYVTNKRVLFDGTKKNTVINLPRITRFTVFSDGLRIEKDSGRDQYFVGQGDPEMIGAVLERVIILNR